MGGCCSIAKSVDADWGSPYNSHPQEHEDLSLNQITPSSVPSGLSINANLQASVPDSRRAPATLSPYDMVLTNSRILPRCFENCDNKASHMQVDFQRRGKVVPTGKNLVLDECEILTSSRCRSKRVGEKLEDEVLNKFTASDYEEDCCPTCLEEYDLENPQIITNCKHHFHLSCILEWMERSSTCPICEQIMVFD